MWNNSSTNNYFVSDQKIQLYDIKTGVSLDTQVPLDGPSSFLSPPGQVAGSFTVAEGLLDRSSAGVRIIGNIQRASENMLAVESSANHWGYSAAAGQSAPSGAWTANGHVINFPAPANGVTWAEVGPTIGTGGFSVSEVVAEIVVPVGMSITVVAMANTGIVNAQVIQGKGKAEQVRISISPNWTSPKGGEQYLQTIYLMRYPDSSGQETPDGDQSGQVIVKEIFSVFRSEARSEGEVAEDVAEFLANPADTKFNQAAIERLANEIEALGQNGQLAKFADLLRSIAANLAVQDSAGDFLSGDVDSVAANYTVQIAIGRAMLALNGIAKISKPTVAADREMTPAQAEALAVKMPGLAELIGVIQLRANAPAQIRNLLKGKGITTAVISYKGIAKANAAMVDSDATAVNLKGLDIGVVGVMQENQQFGPELEATAIALQMMVAAYLATRPDLKAKGAEATAEINKLLFQVGEAQMGVLQYNAQTGSFDIVRSELANFIKTLFEAQKATAIAA
jgi:hypothetical protein